MLTMRRLFWLIAIGILLRLFSSSRDSGQEPTSACDSSYPTICIPSPPPDLDCIEIPYRDFQVTGADPHNFDADHDGLGCEPWAPRDG